MRYVILLGAPGVGKTTIRDMMRATAPDKGKWLCPEDLEVEAARFILSSKDGGVSNTIKCLALKRFPSRKIRSIMARMILAGEYHNTHWSENDHSALNCLLNSMSGQTCPPDIKLMRFKWLLERANSLAYMEWMKGQEDDRVVLFDESIFQVICSLGPWDEKGLEKVREYVKIVGDPSLTIHLEACPQKIFARLVSRAGNKINKSHMKMSSEQIKDDICRWVDACKQLTEVLEQEGFKIVNVNASSPIEKVFEEVHTYLLERIWDGPLASKERNPTLFRNSKIV